MSKPRPTIKTARDLAKAHKLDGCVVLSFAEGQIGAVSYGQTKAQCRQLGKLVDSIVDVYADSADLSAFEPRVQECGCPWPMINQDGGFG